ncbi:Hypothetical predicted protein [Cloeon dipterum]|uniref:BTB domain-containing protein n=1 Tax=Cloeon dipterum TaxID=197152 RepID=A0A8S1DZ63_9INSE|nr:Hypothetical predicted protein [Cloeon dipterum]
MAGLNLMTVASKKLKALQEGLLTDVVFLVGENDETAMKIPAFKIELIVSSKYFANLFNNNLTLKCDENVRLKNIEPQVFLFIVEFTHLSGRLVSDVDSLGTCLKLACAAEEFMIEDLAALCSKFLENKFLSVENVWAVLSEYHTVKSIASPCLQFLCLETRECLLKEESFLGASEEAVKLFVTLEKMNISESELLEACLGYASNKEDKRDAFRRCFLRDLRTLALDSASLIKLAPFLTPAEKISIVSCMSPLTKMIGAAPLLSPGLCPISEGRSEKIVIVGEQTLTLIPDCHILSPIEIYLQMENIANYIFGPDVHDTFVLTLLPRRSIKILGVEIINGLNFHDVAFGGGESVTRKTLQFEFIESSVTSPREFDGLRVHQEVKQDANSVTESGGCTLVKLSTLVPAGAIFVFKARLKENTFLRKLCFYDDDLKRFNEKATMNVFSRVNNGAFFAFQDNEDGIA